MRAARHVRTEAEIRQAYADAFDHDSELEERVAAVALGDALVPVHEQLSAAFPQAVATVEVTVYDVTVEPGPPQHAEVRFELNDEGGAEFGEQTGYAVVVDGCWVVAAQTLWMVHAWGGASC